MSTFPLAFSSVIFCDTCWLDSRQKKFYRRLQPAGRTKHTSLLSDHLEESVSMTQYDTKLASAMAHSCDTYRRCNPRRFHVPGDTLEVSYEQFVRQGWCCAPILMVRLEPNPAAAKRGFMRQARPQISVPANTSQGCRRREGVEMEVGDVFGDRRLPHARRLEAKTRVVRRAFVIMCNSDNISNYNVCQKFRNSDKIRMTNLTSVVSIVYTRNSIDAHLITGITISGHL